MGYKLFVLLCVMAIGWSQAVAQTTEASTTTTTHVPILRQVNTVNEDGSYTYGFEAADGTFKLETRDLNGNVKGKYGFLNEFGELKTVEYSAGNETGFAPVSDLLPKSVPIPVVPQVPQQKPALPQPLPQPQFTPRPQFQPQAQFVPSPKQNQFAPRPQQLQFAQPQPQFLPQQFRTQAQAPQRPINIALDGFSEDRNEDGFVDGSPEEAAKGNPVAPSGTSFLPASTSSLPAPQPVQPQIVQQIPQGFNRFVPNQPPAAPALTAQQIQQIRQQQIQQIHQQQILAAQQEQVPQQFLAPQSIPQGAPQQFVPQQFAPQQFTSQQFAPQQFAGQHLVRQQFAGQQFIPQQFAQFHQSAPVAPSQPKA